MQQAWRLYVEREASFNACGHMNGNRGALFEQLAIESLFNERLGKMKKYVAMNGAEQPAP